MTQAAVHLYRKLYRRTRELPRPSWDYYRRHLRENFVSHSEESSNERLQTMFDRAVRDADWVVNKYTKKIPQTQTAKESQL
ncbi:hypothetical protein WJX82_006065 [Trebouxia sp. C0006]|nr:MAG: hypothetical protein FRX49_06509 [Trebouxia sp. A1-2]